MDLKEDLRVIERVDKALNEQDWKTFDECHAPSVISYSPMTEEPTRDIEAHREAVKEIFTPFPDFRMTKIRSFGQGDWLCFEYTMTGTHTGPFKTGDGQVIPPTNKRISVPISLVAKIKDGKIAEEHIYYDRLAMLSQIGVR